MIKTYLAILVFLKGFKINNPLFELNNIIQKLLQNSQNTVRG